MNNEIHVKYTMKNQNQVDKGSLTINAIDFINEDIKNEALKTAPIEIDYEYTIDYNLENNLDSARIVEIMIENYQNLYSYDINDFLSKVEIHFKNLYEINKIIASFLYSVSYKRLYKKDDINDSATTIFKYPKRYSKDEYKPYTFFELNK